MSSSRICGNFKFQTEENYAEFLEAMGANKEMVDRVMSSLPNVRFFFLFLHVILKITFVFYVIFLIFIHFFIKFSQNKMKNRSIF